MPSAILQPLRRQRVTHPHHPGFAARAGYAVKAGNGLQRLRCHRWHCGRVSGNGFAHQWQCLGTAGIRQPAVMADAHEARWQYVLQETAQEFLTRERHHFLLPITVILVAEAHRFVRDAQQAGFADGNLAGVTCQVLHHRFSLV